MVTYREFNMRTFISNLVIQPSKNQHEPTKEDIKTSLLQVFVCYKKLHNQIGKTTGLGSVFNDALEDTKVVFTTCYVFKTKLILE